MIAKLLRWLETDLGQSLGTLFVAAILWVATFIH
jgi:hypothetical protein